MRFLAKVFVLAVLSAVALPCSAQQDGVDRTVDSLKAAIAQWRATATRGPEDTTGIQLLNVLARTHILSGAADVGRDRAMEAWRLAEELEQHIPGADLNVVYKKKMDAQRLHAMALFFINDYVACMRSLEAYASSARQCSSVEDEGAAYNYMSYCYQFTGDLESALTWSRRSMATMREVQQGIDLANAYVGFSNILGDLNMPDSSLHYLRLALALHGDLQEPSSKASVLMNMMEQFAVMQRWDSIQPYLEPARELVQQAEDGRLDMKWGVQYGRFLLLNSEVDKAISVLQHADSLAQEMEDHRQSHFARSSLALAYAAKGDHRHAQELATLSIAELMLDRDEEKVRELAAIQARAEQKEALAEAVFVAAAKRKQVMLASAGLIAALLLAGVLLWSWTRVRRDARRSRALNSELISTRDQLIATKTQREAESVRSRIARDIHDELGAELTKIALLSDQARDVRSSDTAGTLAMLAAKARSARAALNDVVWATESHTDNAQALLDQVGSTTLALSEGSGLLFVTELNATDPQQPLPPHVKRHLHMIVKEAVGNTLRHARATVLTVRINIKADRFELLVKDDGQASEQARTPGRGRSHITARAQEIGATCTFSTPAGGGTEVRVAGALHGKGSPAGA